MRCLLVSALVTVSTLAADPGPPTPDNPNWFPFPINVMESSKTAIDLSFLNDKPAGASGYLKAEGEHIVDGQGKQVRLFGTNFCFGANFPEAADAEKVAAHLAKNGLNVVRLHHMDNDWGESLIVHEGQLDASGKIITKLHEKNLAKLDKLVAELLKNGIYINLNLHVSRTYPGTPKDAPQYSKGLDYFHPPFIDAFKDYARQLLEHVNPHTGRAYKDEPGIAIIEMNNENTLVLNPWWMAKLGEPFAGELRALFVKHLQKKYPSIEKLREVWGLNDGSTGPNLIINGDFKEGTKAWQSEANFGAKATLEQRSADTPVRRTSADSLQLKDQAAVKSGDAQLRAGVPAPLSFIRWTSTQSGTENYSLQFSQPGLQLEEAKAYRLSFRARSAASATLDVHAQNSAAPWAQLGMQEKMQLKPEWQDFSFEFAPHSVLPDGKNRIVFSLLNAVTSVDITDVKLVSISTGYLKPEHSFTGNHIPIPNRNAKIEVRRDFFDFLMQLEIDHALAMKKFIHEELGAQQMISHSQVLFGGIVGARREFMVSDVVDTHGYWHHPHFPRKSWDMSDWEINNVSQLASAEGGTLAEMAMQRPFGKPYSVSEYDTPAPNDYAAETFPLLAAMACLQDWSAVYHFNFKGSGKYDSDKMTSFFDLPGHPAKQAFMPLAALVFRKGLIEPVNERRVLVIGKPGILDYTSKKAGDVWVASPQGMRQM
ncbi:MAG: carbohydrate binding domain-containing protein [Verrucomicrobiaceae bacterium]|nr:carbohydrate binding domain-containing protein [Verrucomicrobiaceae bacterium]